MAVRRAENEGWLRLLVGIIVPAVLLLVPAGVFAAASTGGAISQSYQTNSMNITQGTLLSLTSARSGSVSPAQSGANSSSKGCSAAYGPLGLIISTPTPPVVPAANNSTTQLTPDNKTLFKIGTAYYRYVPPMDISCSGNGITASTVETQQAALATSFVSVKTDSATSTQ